MQFVQLNLSIFSLIPEIVSKMAKIDKEQLAVEVQKFVYLYDK